ncbi:hypothetical protein ANTQUA_LOCUS6354 [Anthophora quadrimaculata]
MRQIAHRLPYDELTSTIWAFRRNYTCLHTWNVRFILEANQLGTSNIALKFISEARCGSASESTREAQLDFSGISNRLAAVTFPD